MAEFPPSWRNNNTSKSKVNMSNTAAINDEQHQRLEVKLRRELGDVVLKFLMDDRAEDILLNPDSSLWAKRMGEGFVHIGEMAPAAAASAMGTVAAWRGTVLNHERPILETELPLDGSRFEGIVPPVVRRPVFAIRLRPNAYSRWTNTRLARSSRTRTIPEINFAAIPISLRPFRDSITQTSSAPLSAREKTFSWSAPREAERRLW